MQALGLALTLSTSACFRGQRSEKPPIHFFTDMDDQPKYDPYGRSQHFANGASMQVPIEGTIARGQQDAVRPMQTLSHLERGQERYTIFCQPCHGAVGDGQGMVALRGVPRGLVPPTSYHSDYLRSMPDQHFYTVVTQGIRSMSGYGVKLSVSDRWAIVDYVRALQRSQYAQLADVPEELRETLKGVK